MTTSITRTQVLDGWTLATLAGDEEPRVGAFEIGTRAGLSRARNIKKLIDRNRNELEKHGPLHMRSTAERISKPQGGFELREVEEPLLNEAQAINLVALMRTERASNLRVALVKLFVAYRRGAVELPRGTTASIGDSPEAIDRLRLAARRVNHARGHSIAKVYGFLRRTRKVSSPFAIAMELLDLVLCDLERIERGVVLLPAGRAPKQLPANTAQATFKWN